MPLIKSPANTQKPALTTGFGHTDSPGADLLGKQLIAWKRWDHVSRFTFTLHVLRSTHPRPNSAPNNFSPDATGSHIPVPIGQKVTPAMPADNFSRS